MRHGEAAWGIDDARRPLTEVGREQATQQASSLAERVDVEALWVSPYLRAQQTADCFLNWYNLKPITKNCLIPAADIYPLYDELNNLSLENLLIVSHNPFLNKFIHDFCGVHPYFHGMDNATLVGIEYDYAATHLGKLLWVSHANNAK